VNFKKLLIVATIFILVGGFYYFYEIVGKPKRSEKEKKEKAVFTIMDADIKTLDIKRKIEGKPSELKPAELEFEKVEEKIAEKVADKPGSEKESKDEQITKQVWYLRKPIDAKAEQGVINNLSRVVSELKKEEVVDENAKDLKKYGLQEPKFVVVISDGKKKETMELGDQTVDKKYFFAKLPESKTVFLTSSSFRYNMDRFLTDYRDKSLFSVKIEDVDKVALHWEDKISLFEKKDGKWTVVQPKIPRLNEFALENYIKGLLNLKTKEFFKNNEKNRKNMRLADTSSYIEIYEKGGKAPTIMHISTPKKGEKFLYAAVEGRTELYGLPLSASRNLDVKEDRFIKKNLFAFKADKLSRVKFKFPGKEYIIEKQSVADEKEKKASTHKWVMVSPEKKDLDTKKIDRIINNIRNFFAQTALFLDDNEEKFGLKAPSLLITGVGKDGKPVFSMEAGGLTDDKKSIYIRVDNENTVETMKENVLVSLKNEIDKVLGTAPEESKDKKRETKEK